MVFKKCAVAVVGLLFLSPALRAFEVQYGSLFKVIDVQLENGQPVLPLSNGKYADVRVLDKETFDFLKTCTKFCKQSAENTQTVLSDIRPAKTRENMWIAEVEVADKWLLVCLIFRNKKDVSVVFPKNIIVLKKSGANKWSNNYLLV